MTSGPVCAFGSSKTRYGVVTKLLQADVEQIYEQYFRDVYLFALSHGDPILLWEQGMELPPATAAIEAQFTFQN